MGTAPVGVVVQDHVARLCQLARVGNRALERAVQVSLQRLADPRSFLSDEVDGSYVVSDRRRKRGEVLGFRRPAQDDLERLVGIGLQRPDGGPADPPTFTTIAPNWKVGDVIPLGPGRGLRVIAVHAAELVLVVEDASGEWSS